MRHHQRVTRIVGQEFEDQGLDLKNLNNKKKVQELLDKKHRKDVSKESEDSDNSLDTVAEENLSQEAEKPKKKLPPKRKKETPTE